MSPASRGRKKKPSNQQSPERSQNGLFKAIHRDFSAFDPSLSLFLWELRAAEIGFPWWAEEEQPDHEAMLALVDFTRQKPGPASAGVLVALSRFAVEPEIRTIAATALDAMVAKGVPEPEWLAELDQVTSVENWFLTDPYGEDQALVCVFERGGVENGLLAGFGLGGSLDELLPLAEPRKAIESLREQLADGDSLVKLPNEQAARFLAYGLSGVEDVDPEVAGLLPLAGQRCTLLGTPADEFPEPEVDVAAITAQFMEEHPDLGEPEDIREVVGLMIEASREADPRAPLAIGPERILHLLAAVPDELLDDEELLDVLSAWARWCGSRQGLTDVDIEVVLLDLEEALGEPGDVSYVGPEDANLSMDDTLELVDRRQFALPTVLTVLGGDEVQLDPFDEEQRALLVLGEHPELHDQVAEENLDPDAAQMLGLKTMVVHQLWVGDPEEVWATARALRDQDRPRDEIMAGLIDALSGALREVDGGIQVDSDAYRQELAKLA